MHEERQGEMGMFNRHSHDHNFGKSRLGDLGLLGLRLGVGGLVAGHGAQKLFGSFAGPGIKGMGGALESMGLKPGEPWAAMAGLSEFGGGILTALGLGGPIGPIAMEGAMLSAIRRVHWKLPLWTGSGGAELPLTYSLAGLALAANGPGRFSMDRLVHMHVSRKTTIMAMTGVAAGLAIAEWRVSQETPAVPEDSVVAEEPVNIDAKRARPESTGEYQPPMADEIQSEPGPA
jgi:putative oxidoreductase